MVNAETVTDVIDRAREEIWNAGTWDEKCNVVQKYQYHICDFPDHFKKQISDAMTTFKYQS